VIERIPVAVAMVVGEARKGGGCALKVGEMLDHSRASGRRRIKVLGGAADEIVRGVGWPVALREAALEKWPLKRSSAFGLPDPGRADGGGNLQGAATLWRKSGDLQLLDSSSGGRTASICGRRFFLLV